MSSGYRLTILGRTTAGYRLHDQDRVSDGLVWTSWIIAAEERTSMDEGDPDAVDQDLYVLLRVVIVY